MSFAALLPIIINEGIPAAMKLWQLIESKAVPTQAMWDDLLKASALRSGDVMLARLQAAGIDPASPQGKAFLGLTA